MLDGSRTSTWRTRSTGGDRREPRVDGPDRRARTDDPQPPAARGKSRQPHADTDEALVARCLEHDRDAWAAFVDRFARLIYGVVHETLRRHGVVAEPDLADELFGGVFLALYERNYRKLRQWRGGCSVASWIRLVTASHAVDHLRRCRPCVPVPPDEAELLVARAGPQPDDDALALLGRVERLTEVRRALTTLGPSDRELLLRLFRDDEAPADIEATMNIRPGALYTRKNRALARLQAALASMDAEARGP